jgi:hypothetical protein
MLACASGGGRPSNTIGESSKCIITIVIIMIDEKEEDDEKKRERERERGVEEETNSRHL